jgi:hypothetical protein
MAGKEKTAKRGRRYDPREHLHPHPGVMPKVYTVTHYHSVLSKKPIIEEWRNARGEFAAPGMEPAVIHRTPSGKEMWLGLYFEGSLWKAGPPEDVRGFIAQYQEHADRRRERVRKNAAARRIRKRANEGPKA